MEVSLIGMFTLNFTIVMKTDLLGALDFSLWSILHFEQFTWLLYGV